VAQHRLDGMAAHDTQCVSVNTSTHHHVPLLNTCSYSLPSVHNATVLHKTARHNMTMA